MAVSTKERRSTLDFTELEGPGLLEVLWLILNPSLDRDPLKLLGKLKEAYGSKFRVYFPDFGGEALVLSDPEAMEEILLKRQKEFKKPRTSVNADVEQIMGKGLLTTDGDPWRRQHRILMPHFQDNAVESMVPTIIEETERLLDRWSSPGFTRPFDLFSEMKRIGLRFIVRALFSYQLSPDEVRDIRGSIDTLRSAYRHRRTSLITTPFWFPSPNNRRAKQARNRLNCFASNLIARRRETTRSKKDLLDTMLEASDGNSKKGLNQEEIRANIVTFIIAGYTTTAAAMGWTVYELLNHPSQYERVREETRQIDVNSDTVPGDLPYTQAAFNETLRLYPTAPWIARSSKEETTVCNLRLPPDTPIIMTPHLLHRNPDYYESPASFRPSRFLQDPAPDSPTYLPFSIGAHQCIGRQIALVEGPLILGKIFGSGQITRTPETPESVGIHTAVNIEPDRSIPVDFT